MSRKLTSFIEIIRSVKNWPLVLLLCLGLKKKLVVTFRNNIKVEISDKAKLYIIFYLIKISLWSRILRGSNDRYKAVIGDQEVPLMINDEDSIFKAFILSCLYKKLDIKFYPENFCEFSYKGRKIVYFYDPEDFTSIVNLYGTFVTEHYRHLNVKNKVVADIGASYGDTAIYFAIKGAKKVHAYEPIPWVIEILKRNVRANNLQDIVEIYPYAVSLNENYLFLTVPKTATDAASLYYSNKSNNEATPVLVHTVTPPVVADILKMDCEGCEYNIILKWLKRKTYKEIAVEYHEDCKQLQKRLNELGYKVKLFRKNRMLIAY